MTIEKITKDAWFDINTLISTAQPSSIVAIGRFNSQNIEEYIAQKDLLGQPVMLTRYADTPFELEGQSQRFDLAVVANCIEHLQRNQAMRLISRLRDVHCKQFCLYTPLTQEGWQLTDFFALGLQRVAIYTMSEQRFGLFKFNLSAYKNTPDWLNADNWANPDMWGKYWW